ncbi:hypothetical protein U1737_13695 [Sphingomonas sp. LB3N6]|uniref:hypothetical protein n=1 Tax=Sphingomonas fucosidasi TaxID=3096164 RepID=UPI002FC9214C
MTETTPAPDNGIFEPLTALQMFGVETGATLKIERTNLHFAELQRSISAYMATKPFRLTIEPDVANSAKHVRLRINQEVPSRLGAMVGDTIHNLRSALDILACDLARANGNGSLSAIRETYFPISANSELFEKGIRNPVSGEWHQAAKKKIRRLSAHHQQIISSMKPYQGGNDDLWHLHQMDILDKHQLLVPVARRLITFTGPLGIQDTDDAGVYIYAPTREIRDMVDGEILATYPLNTASSDCWADAGTILSLGYGELANEPLIPTLLRMGNAVVEVLGKLGFPVISKDAIMRR